ncbi:MAG TPA: hypothetical protein VNF68_06090 [Candidatus Baltobacteraceae bacterium]|nr:hypothetical protein [Candidatus Baltobacteraceae bacterium]
MTVSWARDRRLNQSLLASIALHAGIALLVPATIVLSGSTSSVETLSFVHIMHVQILRPQPVERQARAVAAVAAPIVHVAPHAATHDVRGVKTMRTNETTQRNSAPTVGAIQRDANAKAQPGASAAPVTAPQAVAPSETPRESTGGYMPFGAEDPTPILDPSAGTALRALDVKVTLVITVDENGRTKNVVFQPPLDASTQARILALLTSARWDPATCGAGVPCEATTTITL